MRYFKSHPALAAVVMLLLLGLVGGAAYAVVREVFITIDPDKPADQIEKDVHDQLQAAGVPATVHADKQDDGRLKIRIGQVGEKLGSDLEGLKINVNGHPGEQRGLRLQLKVAGELSDAQHEKLTEVASGQAIIDLVVERGDKSDADIAAAVKKIFADGGFDVDVTVDGENLTITVK